LWRWKYGEFALLEKRMCLAVLLVQHGERRIDGHCQGECLVRSGLPWSRPGVADPDSVALINFAEDGLGGEANDIKLVLSKQGWPMIRETDPL
jgi:hypothetical protein